MLRGKRGKKREKGMRSSDQQAGLQFERYWKVNLKSDGKVEQQMLKVEIVNETANIELIVLKSCVHACVSLIRVQFSLASYSFLCWLGDEIDTTKCKISIVLEFSPIYQSYWNKSVFFETSVTAELTIDTDTAIDCQAQPTLTTSRLEDF